MFAYLQYKLRKSKCDPVFEYSKSIFGVFLRNCHLAGRLPSNKILGEIYLKKETGSDGPS